MMTLQKLNLQNFRHFSDPEFTTLYFLRPLGSKLFRVYAVPNSIEPEKRKELVQVLNTLCVRKINNVWYFHLDHYDIISETLYFMDVDHQFAEPSEEFYN